MIINDDPSNNKEVDRLAIGTDWNGLLDEWISSILAPEKERRKDAIQDWSFPTDILRDEYLESIENRSQDEVVSLLRMFLFENVTFGADDRIMKSVLKNQRGDLAKLPPEYEHRLLRSLSDNFHAHPGVRWSLDLLPWRPNSAINVINAYLEAYFGLLPDGRIEGLFDAVAIIRARWITPSGNDICRLRELSPRDFERLIAALYAKLGYQVTLTPERSDGGRDVEATKQLAGQNDYAFIECKAHSNPIGVKEVRSLLGVVSTEHANRGILMTTSRFTRGAIKLAQDDRRLELVDGDSLTNLLNSEFGPLWHQKLESIVYRFK